MENNGKSQVHISSFFVLFLLLHLPYLFSKFKDIIQVIWQYLIFFRIFFNLLLHALCLSRAVYCSVLSTIESICFVMQCAGLLFVLTNFIVFYQISSMFWGIYFILYFSQSCEIDLKLRVPSVTSLTSTKSTVLLPNQNQSTSYASKQCDAQIHSVNSPMGKSSSSRVKWTCTTTLSGGLHSTTLNVHMSLRNSTHFHTMDCNDSWSVFAVILCVLSAVVVLGCFYVIFLRFYFIQMVFSNTIIMVFVIF